MTAQHAVYKSCNYLIVWTAILWLLTNSTVVLANDSYCGELGHDYGPFDYTDPAKKAELKLVETHHFNRDVENLISGMSTVFVAGDIHFILLVFPNHHRALHSMSKLSLRDKTPKPAGAGFTTLCYFDRAIRFRPNDAMVRVVLSGHLHKINKLDMALEQLEIATEIEPDNPAIHYNLGLLYLKKRNYDKALHFAKKAYAQDFPLPGLKNQLSAAGKWKK